MSALPRPDLAPGPARELNDALHELHHRAGWPSLRTLAHDAGCSHTTVSHVFSSPKLPTWGVLELLVEAMHGSTSTFHDLWLAASAPSPNGTGPVPRIAGRRSELIAVRRHLESGNGLLLVTGEAGMGKSTVVRGASEASGVPVAVGHCLPLSRQVPLSPIGAVLRTVWNADGGARVRAALTTCPAFVTSGIGPLLPELGVLPDGESSEAWSDAWAGQRLNTSLGALLSALAPMSVVLEDLHWADPATLECLEQLLTSATDVAFVGTWRLDDEDTAALNTEWLARVRRLGGGAIVLGPLSRAETAEQLALLLGQVEADSRLDEIHRRAQGQPLFVEQLSAHEANDAALPPLLADLLDARLQGLADAPWALARALGVADRPLATGVVAEVTGTRGDDLIALLRVLGARRLLADPSGDSIALRHPLLAEGVRRRMVPGEGAETHGRIAKALGARDDAQPGEVAVHWQGAGVASEELPWRVRAAQAAGEVVAPLQESEHWLRVLELWPASGSPTGPSLRTVYARAIGALKHAGDTQRAAQLADQALLRLPHRRDSEHADLLREASGVIGINEEERGRHLIEQSLEIYESLPPSSDLVRALSTLISRLRSARQYVEAMHAARRAFEISRAVGSPALQRHLLASCAWHELVVGEVDAARTHLEAARAARLPTPDPLGELWLGIVGTDSLLLMCADADDVADAGAAALAATDVWHLEAATAHFVRANVCHALARSGRVAAAWELLDAPVDEPLVGDRWARACELAGLEVCRGDLARATERLQGLAALPFDSRTYSAEIARLGLQCLLWSGEPLAALDLVARVLDGVADGRLLADLHAGAARAAADAAQDADPATRRRLLARCESWRRAAGPDLFTAMIPADSAAHGLVWSAELARLKGSETIDHWLAPAIAWDRLTRPFEAAYCRWRGAQVALREGQGTVAARLLRRAATHAREHVPLSTAIRETFDGRT